MENTENLYQTSDWYLCVFLIARGYNLIDVDRRQNNRCKFIFEESFDLEDDVKAFWNNDDIGVQDFVAAVKKTKSILYSDSY